MKTVYFFGAGASAASDFQLPVMNGFFKEEDFVQNGNYSKLKTYLENLYPNKTKADINLEAVITHLELTIEGFNWGFDISSLLNIKRELYNYIQNKLGTPNVRDDKNEEPISQVKICSKHLKFVNSLDLNNDSIISLNYDLVVDNILYYKYENEIDQSKKNLIGTYLNKSLGGLVQQNTWNTLFAVSVPTSDINGFYLKLHGSLNWIYCPLPDCPNNNKFEIKPKARGTPCLCCGTSLEFAIVPPSLKKSFEKFPKLGLLWHIAFNELKAADKIVCIGISLPDSDYYLKWLIQEAMLERRKNGNLLQKLVLVNPNIEHCNKVSDIFGFSYDNFKTFDNYIDSLSIKGFSNENS